MSFFVCVYGWVVWCLVCVVWCLVCVCLTEVLVSIFSWNVPPPCPPAPPRWELRPRPCYYYGCLACLLLWYAWVLPRLNCNRPCLRHHLYLLRIIHTPMNGLLRVPFLGAMVLSFFCMLDGRGHYTNKRSSFSPSCIWLKMKQDATRKQQKKQQASLAFSATAPLLLFLFCRMGRPLYYTDTAHTTRTSTALRRYSQDERPRDTHQFPTPDKDNTLATWHNAG